MKDNIKITFYEDWMKPQISTLFENEYGVKKSDFEELMSKLYEHPIQSTKSIQLVALDDKKVVGFQSFFYWPYLLNNKIFNSFQSGNSLTHPDYRGRGIFKKLLNYVFENSEIVKADFFIGFPVQASYGSFIKNKWENIFNLVWYVKLLNPFAFLFSNKKLLNTHFDFPSIISSESNNFFSLNTQVEFYNWKNELKLNKQSYFYHTYTISENDAIIFEMKFQKRKKIINEVIIGKIYFKGNSRKELIDAIKDVLTFLRKVKCVTICSIAINEFFKLPDYKAILTNLKFNKINKEIYFIVKSSSCDFDINKPELWDVGRADIDTW
jgi:GNAT superfamily N-acetyltransferase